MHEEAETNQELRDENTLLKLRIQELENSAITRMRAEKALENTDAKFRTFAENSTDAIFLSQEGQYVYINPTFERETGYTMDDLSGMNIVDLLHPDFQDMAKNRHVSRLKGENPPSNYEIKYITKGGEERWADLSVTLVVSDNTPTIIGVLCDLSERKRTEEALWKSEEKYRGLIEGMNETLFRISLRDGKFEYLSPSSKLILGYTLEELCADPQLMRRIVHPDFYDSFDEAFGGIKKGDIPSAFKYKIIDLEGKERWIFQTNKGIFDDQGRMIALEGLCRDITEQKQAEDALRESEKKYRLITENVMDVITVQDMNKRISYTSPSVSRLLGITAEDTLGESYALEINKHLSSQSLKSVNLLTEKDRNLIETEMLNTDETHFLELEMRRKDGSMVWVETSVSYMCDENKKPIGVLTATRDISKRKQAEEELRNATTFLDLIVENIPDMVFVEDAKDLRFVRFNRAGEEMTGYSREEMLGKYYHDFFPKKQADLFTAYDLNVLHSAKAIDVQQEVLQTRIKGTRILHTRKIPILDARGEPKYLLGISADITDRIRSEEEKKSLEERLQRAEKMEALGTLAGVVAHDLNNVLGVVVGYAELLLNSVDASSPIRPALLNIMGGGQKAAAIVQDLLTLARRGVSHRQVINLNRIISDLQRSPEFEALSSYHSSVRIMTDLEQDLLNISGSSVHLEKSLFNLLSNASEAMKQGGTLTIKTANHYLDIPIQGYDKIREGDYVVLSISDTGEGIPTSDLKHIFEPFYTKKVMGKSGTGLGLAVVWGTVKDHCGYINVASEVGQGTTFTLYFPVTREGISSKAVAVAVSEYMGNGESILILDDVREQRDLATEMLRMLNYKVTSVSSGEKAVASLKEQHVDLMILDMIMEPGWDGLDTYRESLAIHPKLKAILVSGFSESDRVGTAQSLGAGEYVRKPYVMEKLGMAVREELDRK